MITFFIVLTVIVGILLWAGGVILAVALFADDETTLGSFVAAFMIVITALLVTIFINWTISNAATHGSCKYEHWAGKTYVCDEWYPLPQKGD